MNARRVAAFVKYAGLCVLLLTILLSFGVFAPQGWQRFAIGVFFLVLLASFVGEVV